MSLAPFANLNQRLNRAVVGRLADAVATVGGADVAVLFQKPYAAPFGGEADSAAPECLGPQSALGALERGGQLAIDGVAYEVIRAEPDGGGLVRLILGTV